MTPQNVKAILSDLNPAAFLFENMDDALIGIGTAGPNEPVAIYSRAKIFEKLLADGFSDSDAEDFFMSTFFYYWSGENTPVILDDSVEQ